jgi:hypothetical protein
MSFQHAVDIGHEYVCAKNVLMHLPRYRSKRWKERRAIDRWLHTPSFVRLEAWTRPKR